LVCRSAGRCGAIPRNLFIPRLRRGDRRIS
jgi:hypothetical protein